MLLRKFPKLVKGTRTYNQISEKSFTLDRVATVFWVSDRPQSPRRANCERRFSSPQTWQRPAEFPNFPGRREVRVPAGRPAAATRSRPRRSGADGRRTG